MRTRPVAVLALFALPAVLGAQRIPIRIGDRGPGPAALPPQPGAVARQLSYVYLPVSIESYPMVSYFVAPGYVGGNWSSGGMGQRVDYRVTPYVSATLDLTSSMLGGPANNATAELGTRFHPERNARRVYPFLDLRIGYTALYDFSVNGFNNSNDFAVPGPIGYGGRYSQGYGAIAGIGSEFTLGTRWSVTTGGSVMRGRMTAYNMQGLNSRSTFGLTQYRYTLGLRYNPVHMNSALNVP